MYLFVALLPIILALILMIRFRMVPGKALLLSLGLTALSGSYLWRMPWSLIGASGSLGVLKSLDILLIIFGAVLLLNVLKATGALTVINETFAGFSPDRRIQAIIIGWFFSNFIEGAAGFGAAPALAAPLLAGLGFPVVPALMIALVCNSLPVPFGAVGTPVLTFHSVLEPDLAAAGLPAKEFLSRTLGSLTDISAVSGAFLPFVAVSFMILLAGGTGRKKAILEIFPFAFFSGVIYVIPWKLTAVWLGPELPSILGSAVALPVTWLVLKTGVLTPRNVWEFPENRDRQIPAEAAVSAETVSAETASPGKPAMSRLQAWFPYVIIAILLVLTRIPALPCQDWLKTLCVLRLPELWSIRGTSFRWAILANPGVFPFLLIATATALWGMSLKRFGSVAAASLKQIGMASVAIAASFAMVQIMIFSGAGAGPMPGMLTVIANGAAAVMGKDYLAMAPVIGVFGTFFAGSCTVSNILFGSIQFHTAHLLGLPETVIAALQNVGGGLGSMIRISGVLAACATVNAKGKEGKLLLLNCIPLAVMLLLTLVATLLLLGIGRY